MNSTKPLQTSKEKLKSLNSLFHKVKHSVLQTWMSLKKEKHPLQALKQTLEDLPSWEPTWLTKDRLEGTNLSLKIHVKSSIQTSQLNLKTILASEHALRFQKVEQHILTWNIFGPNLNYPELLKVLVNILSTQISTEKDSMVGVDSEVPPSNGIQSLK